MVQYRQGDVLLTWVGPAKAPTKKATSRMVVAEGEATGHAHVLEVEPTAADKEAAAKLIEELGEGRINVAGRARFLHEEHNTFSVEPGLYEVALAREIPRNDLVVAEHSERKWGRVTD